MKPRHLVIGSGGLLGSTFMRMLGSDAEGLDLPAIDLLADPAGAASAVRSRDAETVINCAAMTDVDACERQPRKAFAMHASAVALLAASCRRLVTFSTDQVFTGPYSEPLLEDAPVSPANAYASGKYLGERLALAAPRSIVVRTSWLFGAGKGMPSFMQRRLDEGLPLKAVGDQVACLTYAPDLAGAVLSIVRDGAAGLFHLVNPGPLSPWDLAVELAGGDASRVERIFWADLGLPARRPVYSALGTSRGYVLPPRCEALARWRQDR
jgi:dTDP-4-dehydrorhamnose reductase